MLLIGSWLWSEVELRYSTSHQQHHTAGAFQAYVGGRLAIMHRLAKTLALDSRIIALLEQPDDLAISSLADDFLNEFAKTAGASDAFLLDADGKIVAQAHEGSESAAKFSYSETTYFKLAMENGHANHIARGRLNEEPQIYMASRVVAGTTRGLAIVLFDVDSISGKELLATHQSGVLLLRDSNGIIFSSTDPSLRYRTFDPLTAETLAHLKKEHRYPVLNYVPIPIINREMLEEAELIELGERLISLDRKHFHQDEDEHAEVDGHGNEERGDSDNHGHRLVLSSAPIPETNWTTVTLMPVPEVLPILLKSLGFALPLFGVIVFATLFLVQRNKYLRELYDRAIRDPLTRLYTRLYMQEAVTAMIDACNRENLAGMSLIMFDLDHFKHVNDTYGHAVGDEVLKRVSALLLDETRPTDIPVRLGGEELALFLPAPIEGGTMVCAERLCTLIRELEIPTDGENIKVTTSAGVARWRPKDKLATMIKNADKALYHAKETGRDKVSDFDQLD